ncbi:phage head closure protein [uncultured Clostridium sp.]|uniref:phage head closure protein n=1 Tax=uncultured Clostridium sp. TaxID=59620 RepID=UPI0026097A28|nr:phage head closure protein [uncultured Clostridium sp.]
MNELVLLGSYLEDSTDDIGDPIKKINYSSEVFCEEKSIKYNEFYQAQAQGFKPEIILILWLDDYNNEKYLKYEDVEYTVFRKYKIGKEKIELTLTRGID